MPGSKEIFQLKVGIINADVSSPILSKSESHAFIIRIHLFTFFSVSLYVLEYLIHMNITFPNSDRVEKVYCGFSSLDYLIWRRKAIFSQKVCLYAWPWGNKVSKFQKWSPITQSSQPLYIFYYFHYYYYTNKILAYFYKNSDTKKAKLPEPLLPFPNSNCILS